MNRKAFPRPARGMLVFNPGRGISQALSSTKRMLLLLREHTQPTESDYCFRAMIRDKTL